MIQSPEQRVASNIVAPDRTHRGLALLNDQCILNPEKTAMHDTRSGPDFADVKRSVARQGEEDEGQAQLEF